MQQLDHQDIETALKPWIVDRSREAAETGRAWNMADHIALIHALKRIDGLVQEINTRLCGCRVGRQVGREAR